MKLLTIDRNSNFTHKGGHPRFVVQAWSNCDGWQSTKYETNDLPMAIELGRSLQRRDASWMGLVRRVQIIDRGGIILPVNIPREVAQ